MPEILASQARAATLFVENTRTSQGNRIEKASGTIRRGAVLLLPPLAGEGVTAKPQKFDAIALPTSGSSRGGIRT